MNILSAICLVALAIIVVLSSIAIGGLAIDLHYGLSAGSGYLIIIASWLIIGTLLGFIIERFQ